MEQMILQIVNPGAGSPVTLDIDMCFIAWHDDYRGRPR